jgi:hypothetical protein
MRCRMYNYYLDKPSRKIWLVTETQLRVLMYYCLHFFSLLHIHFDKTNTRIQKFTFILLVDSTNYDTLAALLLALTVILRLSYLK